MGSRKVLIIGIDGFTWNIAKDFVDEGVMPTLAGLIAEGTCGDLKSITPCETSPAWTSFQTGCLPDKTGVFCFHRYDREKAKITLNSFSEIAVPSLWQLADRASKTVVSLNMPVTFPPPKVNGVIVPGLLSPEISEKTVHPPEAYDKYIKPHKDYRIVNTDLAETLKEFVDNQIRTEKVRCDAALEMMKDIDWDIFSFQMQSSDNLQHMEWWALDKDAKGFTQDGYEEVSRFYKACDEILATLIQSAGEDVLTLIVSDHGFCKEEHWLCINTWLRKKGYLTIKEEPPTAQVPEKSLKEKIKDALPPVKKLAQVYGKAKQKFSSRKPSAEQKENYETELGYLSNLVDHDNTKVFSLGSLGLMIYITGSEDERTELADAVSKELLQDFGEGSAMPLIEEVIAGKNFYRTIDGITTLPDLIVRLKKGVTTVMDPTLDETIISGHGKSAHYQDKQRGTHEPEGVLVMHGPGVKGGEHLDADIIDIVPTVLAYMGLPVPKHIDGKVLTQAFKTPPAITYEDTNLTTKQQSQYSEAEQEEIEKQLGDLGYL
jgi:predicted AlkP superfamily phosphohydrolase/phosphomutase